MAKKEEKKKASPIPFDTSSLALYLSDINKYPLLTVEEEQRLARRFRDKEDLDAGHSLVMANLRFVVKVAFEYRGYGLKMSDLIQEGNIGLMKAVQEFDPDRRIRLISYGAWWIKAYIRNYLLKNWSLVKLGTTQTQRTLFFSLARTKRELERLNKGTVTDEQVAKKMRVKPKDVTDMRQRLDARDLSLDAPIGESESSPTHLTIMEDLSGMSPEAMLEDAAHQRQVLDKVGAALLLLDPRERYIIEMRIMAEKPMTLKKLGEHFQFSRERARQLEIRAKEKLKQELAEFAGDASDEDNKE